MTARWGLPAAGAIVLVDQLVKAWVARDLPYGAQREVIPGLFRLAHSRNTGIAFGLLDGAAPAVKAALIVFVAAVIVVVGWTVWRVQQDRLTLAGLTLVLGGAVGNLIDRLARGEVVDFLVLYVRAGGREHQWPAFNVADAAITVGACCVILAELLSAARARRAPRPD